MTRDVVSIVRLSRYRNSRTWDPDIGDVDPSTWFLSRRMGIDKNQGEEKQPMQIFITDILRLETIYFVKVYLYIMHIKSTTVTVMF